MNNFSKNGNFIFFIVTKKKKQEMNEKERGLCFKF